MEVNNHGLIIYPQNIKNILALFMKIDLRQKVVIIKFSHLVFALKLKTLNITKNFHQELKLKLN